MFQIARALVRNHTQAVAADALENRRLNYGRVDVGYPDNRRLSESLPVRAD